MCECYADCNGDGKVNAFDVTIIKRELGRDDCATNPCLADCNGNGAVTQDDLEIARAQFGRSDCPPSPGHGTQN